MSVELEELEKTSIWFWRGARGVVSFPAIILIAAFVGFAGFARESGMDFLQTMVMSAFVWALPSVVVLVGSMASGASLLATAIAVALSAVRLLPMTISLMPVLRKKEGTPIWLQLLASHFVAVTAWVFAMQRLPELPENSRMPFFLGFCLTLNALVLLSTAIAFHVAGQLPMIAAGALFLLTPVYFLLSLWNTSRMLSEKLAMILGLTFGPLFYLLFPGLDLLVTGLLCGTVAFFLPRMVRWFK